MIETLILQMSPVPPTNGGQDQWQGILQIIWILLIVVFMFYGQKIQIYLQLREIAGVLWLLEMKKNYGKRKALEAIREQGGDQKATESLNRMLEFFTISPQSMDPTGIVWKLDHILDVRRERWLSETKRMLPNVKDSKIRNIANLIEAARALELIWKILRHFYLLGKKTKSMYIVMQTHMILPFLKEIVEALLSAVYAFKNEINIGDGIGPLVVAKLAEGKFTTEIAKEMVMAKVNIDGRDAFVIKALGPGGNVGKPGDAIRRICAENDIKLIITIDASAKWEGEDTGKVVEGIGVAIGGPGVERFKVEERATEDKIPLHAVVIKQSQKEAIAVMKKEIFDSVDEVKRRVKRIILENTKEGDKVIVAGIGNTIGIGQG